MNTTPTLTRAPASVRPVTVRVARWSATHPWRAIGLWLALVAACLAVGQLAGLKQVSDLQLTTGQSSVAAHWLHDAGLDPRAQENVLVTAPAGHLDTADAVGVLDQIRGQMLHLAPVASVAAPVVAPDQRAALLQVTLRTTAHDGADGDLTPLLKVTAAAQAAHPQLRVEQVGDLSLNKAVNDQVNSDLASAADVSLPVTLLILLVAFGAVLAAGVPLLLALSAVGAATGLSELASHLIPDSGSTSSVILLLGMAVGVDYSLFYVKRARAERHAGRSTLDSVEIAAETAGHSVLVSGLAVAVAMCGMYVTGNLVFMSLATGALLVVAVAVLGSLTVVPALLVKLGRAIDRPRVPLLWRLTAADREPRLWPWLLRPALTRPGRTLGVSVFLLAALALPALGMKLASDSPASLPDSIAAKHALTRLTDAFPSRNAAQRIVVKAPAADAGAVSAALESLGRSAAASGLFLPPSASGLQGSSDGTVHVLELDAPYDAEATRAQDGVRLLRAGLVASSLRSVQGARWAVGGDTAGAMDTSAQFSTRLPWVIAFVIVLTMLIMGWVFRSAVIAATTAVMNLLSAGAAFGVLVLVFQHSWAESLLGFHSTGRLINWIPLFCFAVLCGLSMDYHVFVISRIREEATRGLSTREAVRRGLVSSAGTVTSAAVIMVSVFAIFAGLHMVEMKELGVGLAVAVLIDAVVVRIVLLPSLMTLLGRWNWWPGRAPQLSAVVATEREPVLVATTAS